MSVLTQIRSDLRRAAKLMGRSPRTQLVVAEAAAHLVVAKAVVMLLPFERWRAALTREAPVAHPVTPDAERLAELVWAVNGVGARFPERLNCLPRALATRWMMQRRGWSSALELGVARSARGAFEAHAWIEHDGKVVMGLVPDLARFTKLPELTQKQL